MGWVAGSALVLALALAAGPGPVWAQQRLTAEVCPADLGPANCHPCRGGITGGDLSFTNVRRTVGCRGAGGCLGALAPLACGQLVAASLCAGALRPAVRLAACAFAVLGTCPRGPRKCGCGKLSRVPVSSRPSVVPTAQPLTGARLREAAAHPQPHPVLVGIRTNSAL